MVVDPCVNLLLHRAQLKPTWVRWARTAVLLARRILGVASSSTANWSRKKKYQTSPCRSSACCPPHGALPHLGPRVSPGRHMAPLFGRDWRLDHLHGQVLGRDRD